MLPSAPVLVRTFFLMMLASRGRWSSQKAFGQWEQRNSIPPTCGRHEHELGGIASRLYVHVDSVTCTIAYICMLWWVLHHVLEFDLHECMHGLGWDIEILSVVLYSRLH